MKFLLLALASTLAAADTYTCDPQGGERGVCIKDPNGKYNSDSCDNACGSDPADFKCTSDWDCSLAGSCDLTSGQCKCDAWTEGSDCSYLNLLPVDKTRMGYIDPVYTSWGGNAVLGSDKQWHLYMAEIACPDTTETRCGLGNWQTNSQVTHAVSANVDGPYTRQENVAPFEHHNPTLQVSPVDKSWNLFSITHFDGPTSVLVSRDEGKTWTSDKNVTREQNPGPFLWENGTMTMYYRHDGGLPDPNPQSSCSPEGIGMLACDSPTSLCVNQSYPVYDHTSEDPSVFRDQRGNYHMLVNAFPGGCVPKVQQGGHAWSTDGVTWSEPRTGAFNTTVQFTDGTSMVCGRRERPQVHLNEDGLPIAISAGTTGCPAFGKYYKGDGDSFTLFQLLNQH